MKKIIVAGHLCLDITPIFGCKKETCLTDMLAPGKLIKMNGMDIHTGGATANTGLALKKLGADVRILAKVGDDELGAMVTRILESYGVAEGLMKDENSSTSYSVVLAMPGIDRIFLHDPGANDAYSAADLRGIDFSDADLFHFGYPPLMKSLYQRDGEELLKILKFVKKHKIPVSLDMAAVDSQSDAGMVDWKKILERVLPYVDIFVPSIEEILYMTDREKYNSIVCMAAGKDITEVLDIQKDVFPVGGKLLEMGAKIVLLKCGSAGVYLASANEASLRKLGEMTGMDSEAWADKKIFETCFKPEKICSGTGAGDTCIAAFLMALLTGESPQSSLKLAAAEGASCMEAYDAFSALRTIPQLKEKMAAGWEQNKGRGI